MLLDPFGQRFGEGLAHERALVDVGHRQAVRDGDRQDGDQFRGVATNNRATEYNSGSGIRGGLELVDLTFLAMRVRAHGVLGHLVTLHRSHR